MNMSNTHTPAHTRRNRIVFCFKPGLALLLCMGMGLLLSAQVTRETYANGRLKAEGNLVNGTRDGKWIEYANNGTPADEGSYSLGKKNRPLERILHER